jgi:preprotein translocase subunit SecF
MQIINHRKIFYIISGLLLLASIVSLAVWKLEPGIDFRGGSLLSVTFANEVPASQEVSAKLANLGFGDSSVRSTEGGYIVRTREISQEEKNLIVENLGATEREFSSVGPVLGAEAVRKSYFSISMVLLAIVLFVAFAFRKVSKPVSSWVYGLITLLALAHDVIIPAGVFSVLGHFAGYEVDTLFVTALLVILGFSVHDTIVVFDRVRENLKHENEKGSKKPFDQIVGESVSQTFTRSINTSLTTLLAVIVLYFFGPETTKHFSIALIIGLIAGTYSSIFIGSPLLVTINNWRKR